jgi:Fibronectin type III domain
MRGVPSYQFFIGFTMKFSRFFAPLSAVALAVTALVVVSCSTTSDPITSVTVPSAVSSLQATSVNLTTVRIRWTAPTTTGLAGYRITVLNGTTQVGLPLVTGTNTIADISGLTAGTVYTFRVQARTSDTVSAAQEIRWSPAARLVNMQGAAIRVYETASGFGSGLKFQGGTALNLTVANGSQWDLGINTRDAGSGNLFLIGSPTRIGYSSITMSSGRETPTADTLYTNVDSLNQVFDTQLKRIGGPGNFAIPTSFNKGFVLAVRTIEGNHAKVFVKANASGQLLQGTAPDRFIEVEISYQPVANVPYATTPSPFTGERIQNIDGIMFHQYNSK